MNDLSREIKEILVAIKKRKNRIRKTASYRLCLDFGYSWDDIFVRDRVINNFYIKADRLVVEIEKQNSSFLLKQIALIKKYITKLK